MYDLLTIGDIAIDLYFKGESLTEIENRFAFAIGGKYQADFFKESLGGGAANVAVGASKQGLNVAILGLVGENPFKQIIMQKLSRKMVSTELLIIEKDYLNISVIFLNKKGERSIIHFSTPLVSFNLSETYLEKIKRYKSVYLGNTPGVSLEEKITLSEFIKSKGNLLFLNLSGHDCRNKNKQTEKLISYADVFIVNAHEYCELVKIPYSRDMFNKNLHNSFDFFDNLLIVTDAENGSYAFTKEKVYYQKAYKPRRIEDTTGAGDAYTAGFISSYYSSKNIEESLKKGSLYASQVLEKIGAQ